MAELWEEYAPPVFPLGITLNPVLTIDFLQCTATFNRDALIHLQCHRVRIRAVRKTCKLEFHPIFSTEANGLVIDRCGKLHGAKGLMQWLRMDPKIKESRTASLVPKPNGLLVAEYTNMVTPRSAKNAREAHDDD